MGLQWHISTDHDHQSLVPQIWQTTNNHAIFETFQNHCKTHNLLHKIRKFPIKLKDQMTSPQPYATTLMFWTTSIYKECWKPNGSAGTAAHQTIIEVNQTSVNKSDLSNLWVSTLDRCWCGLLQLENCVVLPSSLSSAWSKVCDPLAQLAWHMSGLALPIPVLWP